MKGRARRKGSIRLRSDCVNGATPWTTLLEVRGPHVHIRHRRLEYPGPPTVAGVRNPW